jgi:ferritin-like metal-binding protein YciE
MKMQEKQDKERQSKLKQYVGDMLSLEDHIANAVERQLEEKHLQEHSVEARRIIQTIQQHTRMHHKHLEEQLAALGGDSSSPIKDSVSAVLGAAAGLYDKIRTEEVSKMLRDNYTALNLACISYTMLHTTGLALGEQRVADLALRHLQHYTQIVMDINQAMPQIVVEEFQHDELPVNQMAGQQAVQNTQQAWQPSGSMGGSQSGMGQSGTGRKV